MLADDFYKVIKREASDNSLQAVIEFNKDHEIFKGHFPGQPIVPGVCMVQIIKELTQDFLGKKGRISESGNIKFLAVIDPNRHSQANVSISLLITENDVLITASLFFGETTFFKIKATFRTE